MGSVGEEASQIDAKTLEPSIFLDNVKVGEILETFCSETTTSSRCEEKLAAWNDHLADWRSIFDRYLEVPTLVDSVLDSTIRRLADAASRADLLSRRFQLSAIYIICKVRGYKIVQRFLPNSLEHILIVFDLLKESNELIGSDAEDSRELPPVWESSYVLWHWLGSLSLVPLDITSIDEHVLDKILQEAWESSMATSGPVGTAASVALSRWLSRPDAKRQRLETIDEMKEVLRKSPSSLHNFGVLHTVCNILKYHSSDCDEIAEMLTPLETLLPAIVDQSSFLQAKLFTKFSARLCIVRLPYSDATWRYRRGNRRLEDNLRLLAAGPNDETAQNDKEDNESPGSSDLMKHLEGVVISDEVEDGVGRLLLALGHQSTVVRWSAAKGLSRVVARLPFICGLDVIDAIVELLVENNEDERIWHGGSLGIAELARRGLLLPESLHAVIPLLIRAIEFDVLKGFTSVGAAVRDAACYTYWAMCRSYSAEVLSPYLDKMTSTIVAVSLLDREVNCRRAASAAFQEAVGRQNVPNGIPIIAIIDYHALGNRRDSYTILTEKVAQYGRHAEHILEVLSRRKLFHWDINIRILSSEALGILACSFPKHIAGVVLPSLITGEVFDTNLSVRHGATLGVAEIMMGIAKASGLSVLRDSLIDDLKGIVPKMEQKRLYRGRGGEIMRSAVCRLIYCLSTVRIDFTVPEQVRLLDAVDSSIPHPKAEVSKTACEALYTLLKYYFPVRLAGPSARLQARVVEKFVGIITESANPAATRGYSLALGYVPAKLLGWNRSTLNNVVVTLVSASRCSAKVGGISDVETRRNALRALAKISGELVNTENDKTTREYPLAPLDPSIFSQMSRAFLLGMDDYEIDRRGDVGSWCRIVAMEGISNLLSTLPRRYCDLSMLPQTVALILKQMAEKIDSVRQRAGLALMKLLEVQHLADGIPERNLMFNAIRPGGRGEPCWNNAEYSFNFISAILQNSEVYFAFLLEGLVVSAGGMTESTSRLACTVLASFLLNSTVQERARALSCLTDIYRRNLSKSRIVAPLLVSLDSLLSRGCFKDTNEEFDDFIEILAKDAAQSMNIHRLLQISNICASLWASSEPSCTVRHSIIEILVVLVGHMYPRVRGAASSQLFVITSEIEGWEEATELLTQTEWNSTIESTTLNKKVQQIKEELSVLRSTTS